MGKAAWSHLGARDRLDHTGGLVELAIALPLLTTLREVSGNERLKHASRKP